MVLDVVLILVAVHFAFISVIVIDWLKCRKFPPLVDGSFFAVAVVQFIALAHVTGELMGFNAVERVLYAAVVYSVVWAVVPTTKHNQ